MSGRKNLGKVGVKIAQSTLGLFSPRAGVVKFFALLPKYFGIWWSRVLPALPWDDRIPVPLLESSLDVMDS